MDRKCYVCGAPFQTRWSKKMMCSESCRTDRMVERRKANRERDRGREGYSERRYLTKLRWKQSNIEKERMYARDRARKRRAIVKAAEQLGLIKNGVLI